MIVLLSLLCAHCLPFCSLSSVSSCWKFEGLEGSAVSGLALSLFVSAGFNSSLCRFTKFVIRILFLSLAYVHEGGFLIALLETPLLPI